MKNCTLPANPLPIVVLHSVSNRENDRLVILYKHGYFYPIITQGGSVTAWRIALSLHNTTFVVHEALKAADGRGWPQDPRGCTVCHTPSRLPPRSCLTAGGECAWSMIQAFEIVPPGSPKVLRVRFHWKPTLSSSEGIVITSFERKA